jgi:hypothetical protein
MAEPTVFIPIGSPPPKPTPGAWELVTLTLPPAVCGFCDYTNHKLEVHSDLTLSDLVKVLIEEPAHAAFPDLKERAIKRMVEGVHAALFAYPRLKITLVEDVK